MGNYNIHAGHCPQGQGASGAVGFLQESIENRKVKNRVISALKNAGHTVYDCTDDTNCTANQNLQRIVSKCNAHNVDLDVSIHLNAGGGTGVEVWCYDGKTADIASAICEKVSTALGIPNRGVKHSKGLYVLKNTKSPALLVECCFVDSQNDADKWDTDKCGDAIASAIIGKSIQGADFKPQPAPNAPKPSKPSGNPIIRDGQVHARNFAVPGLKSDGIPGPETNKAKVKVLQQAVNLDYRAGLSVDGIWGSRSEAALKGHTVRRGETQYMVTALEILLMLNGYNPNGLENPGTFGSRLEAAVRQFQKDRGLSVDGIAGYNTFKALIK
ncbi:MAG: N-acetylmuramoyl-L-alanine amidase [Blautia hansenii]|uniref:N-acetylmuramoyl-L-alanine amidase n=1 Tax=Blautia sp. TaxID=1955243 RepID=UPI0025C32B80|nr:N-acetylmuramoyl-L-alanine amidase [Blautia sp.]